MRESNIRNRTILVVAVAVFVMSAPTSRLVAQADVNFKNEQGKIAFVSGVDVYTVSSDGSDLKQLTNFGASGSALQPSWSSDGEKIVFSFAPATTGLGELWEMDWNGANLHRLHRDAAFGDFTPHFSPDRVNIVFSRCSSIQCAIYRIQSDGTGLKALTQFNYNPDISDFQPSYSPDGSSIAFGSYIRGGLLCAVYLMNADGSNIRPLTPPETLAFMPAWSPDGTSITFSTNGFYSQVLDEEIWRINVDGTGLTQLTNNNQNWSGYFSGAHDKWSWWSPQGNRLVFEEDAPDFSTAAIYLMNSDGTGPSKLRAAEPRQTRVFPSHAGRRSVRANAQQLLQLLENNAVYPNWGPTEE